MGKGERVGLREILPVLRRVRRLLGLFRYGGGLELYREVDRLIRQIEAEEIEECPRSP